MIGTLEQVVRLRITIGLVLRTQCVPRGAETRQEGGTKTGRDARRDGKVLVSHVDRKTKENETEMHVGLRSRLLPINQYTQLRNASSTLQYPIAQSKSLHKHKHKRSSLTSNTSIVAAQRIITHTAPPLPPRYSRRLDLLLRSPNMRVMHLRRKFETRNRLLQMRLQRANHDKHQSLRVATERIL
jgi:hypothetical protein